MKESRLSKTKIFIKIDIIRIREKYIDINKFAFHTKRKIIFLKNMIFMEMFRKAGY